MIVRCKRVDRYLFDAYFHSSRVAQEWMEQAKLRAAWFDRELLADFFLCFYLADPELDQTQDAPPFHRWLVQTLRKQYFYRLIHPRTEGQESAAFKTAIKALMWLSQTYAEEVQRREKEQRPWPFGMQELQGEQGEQQANVAERLTDQQIEQLRLTGFTLQQGKRMVEDKQSARDHRPLVEQEIKALRQRLEETRAEMKTQFTKRSKLLQKSKKLEEELAQREKQLDRLERQEKAAIERFEQELGQWVESSLKQSLAEEAEESSLVHDLLLASQRFANRRWGSELGKLRRQSFEQYLQWVEKLKKYPDLLQFIQQVGRNVHEIRVKQKQIRRNRLPEEYYDLRQSNDISHLLPSEAVLLADPELETYFMLKYVEEKLFTYDTAGWVEQPPKGPVICMLDTSHSMRGAKLKLAQIFVMTFAALSLLEKRDFLLLLFGAKGELKEQPLYYRRPNWPAFYALAQMAFGGGTHFDAPLKRAIELVDGEKTFRSADFVMVTDGVGGISPNVQGMLAQLAKQKQVRLHSLIVGSARQHLIQKYDIAGVSHQIRFATTWETSNEENTGLLLDVFEQ
ncbi:vWA domain-containing protein [Brevibacillus fulvus]|uniref:Uncharacterized protein with von Willebrand factor type A (VWA) domain n=1 Tax=Brevibacillus fulvus TaxID=1125967 RepID=A0A938XWJ8_9BACL|nr:hypothetical protein [Brevibacillus fulvus]MBM7588988.1 uncharacterized protein with von Willebrand factor type A (vWA) domain [Brevibacillus fulvus]